jgi:hypothetical protein
MKWRVEIKGNPDPTGWGRFEVSVKREDNTFSSWGWPCETKIIIEGCRFQTAGELAHRVCDALNAFDESEAGDGVKHG